MGFDWVCKYCVIVGLLDAFEVVGLDVKGVLRLTTWPV
jgi:hypothetical protein